MPQDLLPNTLYDLSEQLNMEKRKGRYKLYERSKTPVSFKVQEQDVKLLRALEEYRFLEPVSKVPKHAFARYKAKGWKIVKLEV